MTFVALIFCRNSKPRLKYWGSKPRLNMVFANGIINYEDRVFAPKEPHGNIRQKVSKKASDDIEIDRCLVRPIKRFKHSAVAQDEAIKLQVTGTEKLLQEDIIGARTR